MMNSESLAMDLLEAKLVIATPDLTNLDAMNGATVSIDMAGAQPVIFNGPE
jgi:hypothetical protein